MNRNKLGGTARSKTNDLNQAIIKYLNLNGFYVWRNNTVGIYDPIKKVFRANNTHKGVGDVVGLTPNGRHIEIETKRKDEKQSIEQIEHERQIDLRGGYYFVARNINDIINNDTIKRLAEC